MLELKWLTARLPTDYPYVPPICTLVTEIDHSHVDANRRVWSRVLSGANWNSETSVVELLQHIRLILRHQCSLQGPCML
jgi:ubiquitin-protein ligase